MTTEKLMCRTCGGEGDCGGTIAECANCWEVERRLECYLKTKKGRAFVAKALKKAVALAEARGQKSNRRRG